MPFPSDTLFPYDFLVAPVPLAPVEGFDQSDFPVEITDEFTFPEGRWYHYDSIPSIQRIALRNQRHVNIRSFSSERRASLVNMLFMDRLTMYDINGHNLADFTSDTVTPAHIVIEDNERWTNGTVERQSDRNNWDGISLECDTSISNLNVTQSVILI